MSPLRALRALLPLMVLVGTAAAEPAPPLEPRRYAIHLQLDLDGARFAGDEQLELEVARPTRELALDAEGLTVTRAEARLGGRSVALAVRREPARVVLVSPVRLSGAVTVALTWHAAMSDDLVGLTLLRTGGERCAFTHFEPAFARRVFPGLDDPRWKTPFQLTVDAPGDAEALSNGPLEDVSPLPGGRRFRFSETRPLPTYLVALAVGRFDAHGDQLDGVPVRIFTPAGSAAGVDTALDTLGRALPVMRSWLDAPFPFAKLDVVALPDFAPGAMENAGLIFVRASRLADRRLLLHELAHQWLGDAVTPRAWDQLWLSEALATFAEYRLADQLYPESRAVADLARRTDEMLTHDALDGTRPVEARVTSPAGAAAMFDDLTYIKGARVVRAVEDAIGAEAFARGLGRFVAAHRFGSADGDDLWRALEQAAGRPLAADAQHWLRTPGHPLVTVEARCDGDRLRLTLRQQTDREPGAVALPDDHWALELGVRLGDGPPTVVRVGARPATILGRAGAGCPSYQVVRGGAPLRLRYEGRAPAPPDDPASALAELDDAWAAVRRGDRSTAWFLATLPGLAGSDPSLDADITRRLRFIAEELLPADERQRFAGEVARVLPRLDVGRLVPEGGVHPDLRALLEARGSSLLERLQDALSAPEPARGAAWKLFVGHFDDLLPRLPRVGYGRLLRAVSGFCDDHERRQVHTFFEQRAHLPPGAPGTLRSTEEEIAVCTALQRRESQRLTAWLRATRR